MIKVVSINIQLLSYTRVYCEYDTHFLLTTYLQPSNDQISHNKKNIKRTSEKKKNLGISCMSAHDTPECTINTLVSIYMTWWKSSIQVCLSLNPILV